MSALLDELVKKAQALPTNERVVLAQALWASVEAEEGPEIEAAWEAEITRRLAAYDRGEVRVMDADAVHARAAAIAR